MRNKRDETPNEVTEADKQQLPPADEPNTAPPAEPPADDRPVASDEPAAPEVAAEPVYPPVLLYRPRYDGEYLVGVPARDLTAVDLASIDPWHLVSATAPGPDGTPLYHPVTEPSE